MWPVPEKVGLIYMPNERGGIEDRERPDVGTVLAVGELVGLVPGDIVLVAHEHGKRISYGQYGDYVPEGELRFYGAVASGAKKISRVRWKQSILAILNPFETMDSITEALPVPTGNNVLIRRQSLREDQGGLYLPESEKYRSPIAEVVAVGREVGLGPKGIREFTVEKGQKWVYMATVTRPLKQIGFPTADPDLAFIDADALLCEVA